MRLLRVTVALAFACLATSAALTSAALARTAPAPCKPCGEWQLDAAATEPAEPAIDAALARYKEPRPRRRRAPYGDIAAETEAEFLSTLDRLPGPENRGALRVELTHLLKSPPKLRVRQDGDDIVIESPDGATRRLTPGEPHARVDERGTAEIVTRWQSGNLTVTETYRRKTQNRESYALDAAKGRLRVIRSVSRPGLPLVTVHSAYQAQ